MIILDVNVLVAAYLATHERHEASVRFLEDCLFSGDTAAPDVVWSGFIRIVTNPEVVNPVNPWSEIRAFTDTVRNHPGYRSDVRGLNGPLDSFLALCQVADAHHNLVSDAYIAAVAIEHNASVGTWDTDFDKLPVSVVHPTVRS